MLSSKRESYEGSERKSSIERVTKQAWNIPVRITKEFTDQIFNQN